MRARAELTAAPPIAPGGPSRLTRRRDGAPLAWRSTPDAVYLVGTAATPVGDDTVDIDVVVETGANLTVRSTAATVAWSGTATTQRISSTVAAGATLDWHLQPLVATGGCRHRQDVTILLERAGLVRWSEELVLGRCGESPGHLDLRLAVDLAGHALLRHQLSVGPDVAGWGGPAVLGEHRAVGLVLRAGRGVVAAPPAAGPGWAVLNLDGPAVLGVAVADELSGLHLALAEVARCLDAATGGPGPGIVTRRCPC